MPVRSRREKHHEHERDEEAAAGEGGAGEAAGEGRAVHAGAEAARADVARVGGEAHCIRSRTPPIRQAGRWTRSKGAGPWGFRRFEFEATVGTRGVGARPTAKRAATGSPPRTLCASGRRGTRWPRPPDRIAVFALEVRRCSDRSSRRSPWPQSSLPPCSGGASAPASGTPQGCCVHRARSSLIGAQDLGKTTIAKNIVRAYSAPPDRTVADR
jgi:hypothetical protein